MEEDQFNNKEDKIKFGSKIKKTIKSILGSKPINPILSAIIGGIILYFAQQYLDKDRIEIVDASIRVKKIELQLNQQTIVSLKATVPYNNDINQQNASNILSTDQIIAYLRGNIQNSNNYQNQINFYRNYSKRRSNILLNKGNNKVDSTADISLYKEEIDMYTNKLHDLDSLKTLMVNLISKQIKLNKDNFFIEVIVQNKGNKQGIIKYKAVLQIGETSINLTKSNNQYSISNNSQNKGELLNNFLTVEAHSFNGLSFDIDSYFNKPGDIEIAKKEFGVGQKKGNIILYSVENMQIAKFEVLCTDDLSRNENGQLIQFLTDNNLNFNPN